MVPHHSSFITCRHTRRACLWAVGSVSVELMRGLYNLVQKTPYSRLPGLSSPGGNSSPSLNWTTSTLRGRSVTPPWPSPLPPRCRATPGQRWPPEAAARSRSYLTYWLISHKHCTLLHSGSSQPRDLQPPSQKREASMKHCTVFIQGARDQLCGKCYDCKVWIA